MRKERSISSIEQQHRCIIADHDIFSNDVTSIIVTAGTYRDRIIGSGETQSPRRPTIASRVIKIGCDDRAREREREKGRDWPDNPDPRANVFISVKKRKKGNPRFTVSRFAREEISRKKKGLFEPLVNIHTVARTGKRRFIDQR